ncbi:MAG TPA: hypothetical protein VEH81_12685 [Ktedonobacteraceae bacterium]|nr:hypothetical protein [Ktedonobacteraceae bacterium]
METNPYTYDRKQTGMPQQNQYYQKKLEAQNEHEFLLSQPQNLTQHNAGQQPGIQVKMPKAHALALANAFKRTLAVASIVGFGLFGGLVAMHQVSTTTTQSIQSTSGSSNTSSNSNASSQNSNSFFKQQGGNTGGTSSTTSSSTTTNNTTATPVTGTSTS